MLKSLIGRNRPGVFDALFNEQKFIKDTIYSETEEIANMIYYLSNNLKYIEDYDVDKEIEAKVYGESLKNTYKYAILNKTTGNIITSDYGLEEFYGPNYGLIDSEDVLRYLKNRGFANIMIDNVDTFNSYINSDIKYVEKEGLSNYEEFYYTYPEGYKELIREKAITAKLMIVTTIISILLFFKLLINIVTNGKEVNLKINTVHRLFYVLRYGFKYKYTRNKLVTAIVAAFIVIVCLLIFSSIY